MTISSTRHSQHLVVRVVAVAVEEVRVSVLRVELLDVAEVLVAVTLLPSAAPYSRGVMEYHDDWGTGLWEGCDDLISRVRNCNKNTEICMYVCVYIYIYIK